MNNNPEVIDDRMEQSRVTTVEPAPVQRVSWWRKLLLSTKSYTVELLIAVNAFLALGIASAYALVMLWQNIGGLKEGKPSLFVHELSLVLVAFMLVLLPVAVIFYARTRGELVRNPAQAQRAWHKVVLGWFYVHVVVFAVTAGFVAVYSVLQLIAGETNVKDTLLKVTMPALLIALYFTAMYGIYGVRRVSRKLVMIVFTVITTVLLLTLLIPAILQLKDTKADQRRSDDIQAIAKKVNGYYEDNSKLPTTLNDVQLPKDAVRNPMSEYTYKKDSATTYQICSRFKTSTGTLSSSPRNPDSVDFSEHGQGEQCFKLRSSYSFRSGLDEYSKYFKDYSKNLQGSESLGLKDYTSELSL